MTDTATKTDADHSAVADALAELERTVDQDGRGCPFELWIARATLATVTIGKRFNGDQHRCFMDAAERAGFFEAGVEPSWTLQ